MIGFPEVSAGTGWQKKEFRSASKIEGTITFSDLTANSTPFTPPTIIHYFADELNEGDMQLIVNLIVHPGDNPIARPTRVIATRRA